MRGSDDGSFYAGAGPLAALLLGVTLAPLRGASPASSFAFGFLALIMVAAELGGRGAALLTTLVSALSLQHFLTQSPPPLPSGQGQDAIAVVGLGACGLIAAALGPARRQRLAALSAVAKQRDLLRSVLGGWSSAAALEPQLESVLKAAQGVFPWAGAVIRDDCDRVLATCDPAAGLRPLPRAVLEPEALVPSSRGAARRFSFEFPREGGRIALRSGKRPLGWLDVWGDGGAATAETGQALTDFARLLALLLAAETRTAPRAGEPAMASAGGRRSSV